MTLRLPASTPRATRSAAAEVAGEDRAGQAVLGVVGQRDRVGLVVERHHRDDRAEDLLAPDPARRVVGESPPSAAARSRRRRASRRRRRRRPRRGSPAPSRAGRAEISGPISLDSSARVERPSSPRTAGSRRPRNSSYADRSTRIRERAQQSWPALSKTAYGAAGGRRGEVGVGEDDVGALAAELEGHPLHLVGAAGHDLLADLGRAGEADLADQRVGDEPLADDRALARDAR